MRQFLRQFLVITDSSEQKGGHQWTLFSFGNRASFTTHFDASTIKVMDVDSYRIDQVLVTRGGSAVAAPAPAPLPPN